MSLFLANRNVAASVLIVVNVYVNVVMEMTRLLRLLLLLCCYAVITVVVNVTALLLRNGVNAVVGSYCQ